MKLVTLLDPSREEHLALVIEHKNAHPQYLDLVRWNQKTQTLKHPEPQRILTNMIEWIKEQSITLPWAQTLLQHAKENLNDMNFALVDEQDAFILAPIPRPVSCRDGYAFRQHVEAARRNRGVPMIPEFDEFPIFYYTNHLAITGPGELFIMPKALERFDFELEVAIVIGKEGRNIPASKADEHIFGYMIMNDWSARELQMQEMKLNLGPAKGKDMATSIGPYLVTRDSLAHKKIPGPHGERYDLTMKAFHNEKQVSLGNLKDMTWTFAQIIERASYGVTLYPGEVIGSGTVGTGCYLELNGSKITDNVWIKPNDTFRLEVDELGTLENTILKEN